MQIAAAKVNGQFGVAPDVARRKVGPHEPAGDAVVGHDSGWLDFREFEPGVAVVVGNEEVPVQGQAAFARLCHNKNLLSNFQYEVG
jgi:hypothetical protein